MLWLTATIFFIVGLSWGLLPGHELGSLAVLWVARTSLTLSLGMLILAWSLAPPVPVHLHH